MKQYTRRTPEHWRALIDKWRDSGLSAARFCEEQHIGYASFCNWRKRLADEPAQDTDGKRRDEAAFIDLAALAATGQGGGWSIVLSLGDGVELRLNRL